MPAVTATGYERHEPAGTRVAVTVGTDHHPFNRLIYWVNDWLETRPEQIPEFFVQSGAASVIPACPASRSLDVSQLAAVLDQADVIVCHGGPASIAAAWAREMLPIVVPRLPQLGEHVDDHQVTFCLKLAELGRISLAQTPEEFASSLAAAIADRTRSRAGVPAADVAATVARFGELVEQLLSEPRRRLPPWHRSRRIPHRQVSGPFAAAVTVPQELIPRSNTTWNAHSGRVRADLPELRDAEQE
jgi:UDP-N-acetylglucosamine transferase subunit ALG13